MKEYGLTADQAERQLWAQDQASVAAEAAPAPLKAAFSGLRIFHESGGRVEVTVADSALASEAKEHYSRYGLEVDVAIAPLSMDETERRIDEINRRLRAERPRDKPPAVLAGEPVPGWVTISIAPGPYSDQEEAIINAASEPGAPFRIEHVDEISHAKKTACDYTPDIRCDPPIRGSIRIGRDNAPNYTPNCTAAFNATSRLDDKPYMLTAGHCEASDDVWARFSNNTHHRIGPWWDSEVSSDTDVGIIAVAEPAPAPAGWSFGWPLITLGPNHGPDDNYVINSVGEPYVGYRVCVTGGNGDLTLIGGTWDGGRTDCGTVDIRYATGDGVDGLFRTEDICAVPGDSGSPIFSYGVAYGVQHGANWDTGCTHIWSEQATEAEDQMRVDIVTT